MLAKYPGRCYICGTPIEAGVDHYDLTAKRSFHSRCQEREDDKPDESQIQLADRLGFKHYERNTNEHN